MNAYAPVGRNTGRATTQCGSALRDVPHKSLRIEIRLAILDFGFRCHHGPGQADVDSQVAAQPPVILNERPNQLVATAHRSSQKSLIVGGKVPHPPDQSVGNVITRQIADLRDKAILESVVSYIHLVIAKYSAKPDLVLAPDQLESIGNRVDVAATLVRRISAVAHGVVTGH